MTNKEVLTQELTKAEYKKFISNIETISPFTDFADWFLEKNYDRESAIGGAFAFSSTKEGFTYWCDINGKLKLKFPNND